MDSLSTTTALGGLTPRTDTFDGLTITEVAEAAFASLALRAGATDAGQLGVALPDPAAMVKAGDMTAIWTGPEQWLVMSNDERITTTVKEAFGQAASVTDQTGAWVRFDLEGPGSIATLQRLTMLDVEAMTAGYASRTVVEHQGVILMCRSAGTAFTVLGARSMAASLHHALTTAAASAL